VGEDHPLVLGDPGGQVAFDFFGVGVFVKPSFWLIRPTWVSTTIPSFFVEGVAQDDVGGFAADAGEVEELLHGLRDLALVFFDKRFGHGLDVLRLVAIKTGG